MRGGMSDRPARQIAAERVRAVYDQMPVALAASVVIAALTAVALYRPAIQGWLSLWAAAVAGLSLMRLAGWAAFRRAVARGARVIPWEPAALVGAAASGLLWGAVGALLFPPDQAHQLFLSFVIGGMCAGAVTVHSAHLPTVLLFIWPAAAPLALRLLLLGSAIDTVSAAMTAVFASALSVIAWRFHLSFGRTAGLQLALAERSHQLAAANARLQAEIAEHQATEATLRHAQKMQSIGRLTAGMAHDFNNLLAVVGGSVGLLQAKLPPHDRYADHLATILDAVDRGALLTRQLLAFARQQKLQPRPTDPNGLLRDMTPLLRGVVGGKVRLQFDLAADVWPAEVDPNAVEHAVMNLVINARDALDQDGSIRLATANATMADGSVEGRLAAGDYVCVSIADTGCGMSEQVLARAFEPFFSTKDSGKGSGLGLSQVDSIMRQSGGAVDIASALGQGTRVTLYLPRACAADAARPAEPDIAAAEPAAESPAAGSRVFVVAGDPALRAASVAALQRAGHEALAAGNTAGALRLVQTEIPPDLVVLQAPMPEGTGDLLARLIRHRFAAVPIVFVTADPAAEDLAGERWVLPIPFGPDALPDLVAQALPERDRLPGANEPA
jgi:signal transduction histidine kinase/CheY-like chemotaxis protein